MASGAIGRRPVGSVRSLQAFSSLVPRGLRQRTQLWLSFAVSVPVCPPRAARSRTARGSFSECVYVFPGSQMMPASRYPAFPEPARLSPSPPPLVPRLVCQAPGCARGHGAGCGGGEVGEGPRALRQDPVGQVRDDQVPPLGVRDSSFPSWQSVLLVLGQPLHWFSRLLPCAPPACLAPPDRPSPSRPSTGVARAFCSHLPQGLRFTENCRLPPWVPVWDLVYEAAAVTSTSLSGCTEGLELPPPPSNPPRCVWHLCCSDLQGSPRWQQGREAGQACASESQEQQCGERCP